MKGIILAGGKGTRLYPLTKVTNKHLLPVGKEPMIFHPIRQLVSAGILQIMIVTSTDHMGDIVKVLGSGKEFGCEFTFKVQEEAKGIADALSLAENFAGNDKIVVFLGDNVFEYSISPYVRNFEKQEKGARVLLKKVNDPERFGIAAMDEKHILEIEEKPQSPKTDFAVVGVYMYNPKVFDILKKIKPSDRGEYEITSVNNVYIKDHELKYDIVKGRWVDSGTFESYFEANELLYQLNNKIKM
ncbi:MAG: sugar phosphate nucleotidyltransferase [Candidatus Methanoperedens sp.]|nr:sugar phosphate nucleotidyltransferase [Candidatus Methanoperedens sp.]MCZ7371195.1 sugar phosphate nucleotidyltransferase [Candidatus Methanoperedens sp.]